MKNLPAKKLYEFHRGDFRALWDSLAANPAPGSRGNFAFGLMAMMLLELASRACEGRAATRTALADALHARDPRYFTALPFTVPPRSEFEIPAVATSPANQQLLSVLFDLIRNGGAHQYQQIIVDLGGGQTFAVGMTGCQPGRDLATVATDLRRDSHLSVRYGNRQIKIVVRPDTLFLDLEAAIGSASVFKRGVKIAHLIRPRPPRTGRPSTPQHYAAPVAAIRNALYAGGHPRRRSGSP